jgi:hypothetical protein
MHRLFFLDLPILMSAAPRFSAFRSLSLALLAPLTVLLTGCGGPNLFERMSSPYWGFGGTIIIVLDLVALVDLLGDEGRSTTNRVIWTLLIVFFPLGGVILYFLFGRE